MQRRLATILVADVVGYSRLMEAAEETTAARLQTCHQLMSKSVATADGRVFNRAGGINDRHPPDYRFDRSTFDGTARFNRARKRAPL